MDAAVHATLTRLLDFAQRATARHASPVREYRDLLPRLQISPAVLSNWKRRGVSKEGALAAEAEFGCSAHWVLTGEGNPLASSAANAAEPPAHYATGSEAVLDQLARLLQHLPPGSLDAYVDVLAAWARRGGRDPARRSVLLAMASAETKQLRPAGL